MKTVHKHAIMPNELVMAFTGRPVGFGAQNGRLVFWAETDEPITRHLGVFGTGWDIPDTARHLFTAQSGEFVWHLYELDSPR